MGDCVDEDDNVSLLDLLFAAPMTGTWSEFVLLLLLISFASLILCWLVKGRKNAKTIPELNVCPPSYRVTYYKFEEILPTP